MLQMFVEGANYIAAECQVMMRGQGILKIEAAEVTLTIYHEIRSDAAGNQVIACHMRGNTHWNHPGIPTSQCADSGGILCQRW